MPNQNRTLRELVVPDPFFADFPSLSDFDDTYIYDVCTDIYLWSVCAGIEVVLHVDISINKIDVAYVNVVPAAKILSSIEKPSTLKLKSLPSNLKYTFLEFEENLHVIFLSKLGSEHE